MSLPKVNLDDKKYADIIREATARISSYAPEWTNHNPADPGITLLELFSWFIEGQLYRLNKISDKSKINFLKLLGIEPFPNESIESAIIRAQHEFRKPTRAVTSADYEYLVLQAVFSPEFTNLVQPCGKIARVKALPGYHPRLPQHAPDIVTIVLIPEKSPVPENLISALYAYLDTQYRLLTVELFLMEADYIDISVKASISIKPTVVFDEAKARVETRLREFLNPLTGGMNGKGWSIGRGVYRSEIYRVIDDVEGVDFAEIAENGITGKFKGTTLKSDTMGNLLIPQHSLARFSGSIIQDYSKDPGNI